MHEKELAKFRIIQKIKRLLKYLTNLKARNFASSSSIYFASDLEKILSIILTNIDLLPLATYHNFENYLDDDILEVATFIERSTPSYIPWSILDEFENICKQNIDKDVIVVLKSDLQYNYSVDTNKINIIVDEIKGYLGNLAEFNQTKFSNTRIFTIPLLEKTNAILHSILFHEVGHHHHLIFERQNQKLFKNALEEVHQNQLKRKNSTGGNINDFNEDDLFTLTQAEKILKEAVKEIYSDIYAYKFCGLSIIFSLRYFHIKYPVLVLPDIVNNFLYPPVIFRIRTLINIAQNDGTLQYFENSEASDKFKIAIKGEINLILEALKNNEDIKGLHSTNEMTYAYKALEILIPNIIDDVSKIISSPFIYSENHSELFNRLLEGIPPCEINNVPQKLVDILLSGWGAYFNIINDNLNVEDSINQTDFINKLILKAITQSNFMQKYQSQIDGNA